MEDDEFLSMAPVYGLIFLFKWTQEMAQSHRASANCVENSNLYFAKQVIQNACGTQALLNIMMNVDGIQLGDELSSFKSFTADFPAELKGESMSNSELIRTMHNSFARPEPFEMTDRKAGKDDDVYHFTAYMPFGGSLWELDGLQEGPILLGACDDPSNWWKQVRPILNERIEKYSQNEIRFNLLAVCRNKRDHALSLIAKHRADCEIISAALLSHGVQPEEEDDAMTEDVPDCDEDPVDCSGKTQQQLQDALSSSRAVLREAKEVVREEDDKNARFDKENARRKHNFIPFIIQLLQGLASVGKLAGLREAAEARAKEKAATASAK
uniref:Ubiquitin carboxyl-terminal hydrolase n=1 Tax=Hemiselmis tepida TaxID=464990 RepID=A0A7S0YYI3_9CRYP